jgi:hypothetical protein
MGVTRASVTPTRSLGTIFSMFKVWTGSDADADSLARQLEAHLNEFAAEVVAISYSVADDHFVMAVYRPVEVSVDDRMEAAVGVAEDIVSDAQEERAPQ